MPFVSVTRQCTAPQTCTDVLYVGASGGWRYHGLYRAFVNDSNEIGPDTDANGTPVAPYDMPMLDLDFESLISAPGNLNWSPDPGWQRLYGVEAHTWVTFSAVDPERGLAPLNSKVFVTSAASRVPNPSSIWGQAYCNGPDSSEDTWITRGFNEMFTMDIVKDRSHRLWTAVADYGVVRELTPNSERFAWTAPPVSYNQNPSHFCPQTDDSEAIILAVQPGQSPPGGTVFAVFGGAANQLTPSHLFQWDADTDPLCPWQFAAGNLESFFPGGHAYTISALSFAGQGDIYAQYTEYVPNGANRVSAATDRGIVHGTWGSTGWQWSYANQGLPFWDTTVPPAPWSRPEIIGLQHVPADYDGVARIYAVGANVGTPSGVTLRGGLWKCDLPCTCESPNLCKPWTPVSWNDPSSPPSRMYFNGEAVPYQDMRAIASSTSGQRLYVGTRGPSHAGRGAVLRRDSAGGWTKITDFLQPPFNGPAAPDLAPSESANQLADVRAVAVSPFNEDVVYMGNWGLNLAGIGVHRGVPIEENGNDLYCWDQLSDPAASESDRAMDHLGIRRLYFDPDDPSRLLVGTVGEETWEGHIVPAIDLFGRNGCADAPSTLAVTWSKSPGYTLIGSQFDLTVTLVNNTSHPLSTIRPTLDLDANVAYVSGPTPSVADGLTASTPKSFTWRLTRTTGDAAHVMVKLEGCPLESSSHLVTYCVDDDNDGFGVPGDPTCEYSVEDCAPSNPNLPKSYYRDSDADGFGLWSDPPDYQCTKPAGKAANRGDWDDLHKALHCNACVTLKAITEDGTAAGCTCKSYR